MSVVIPESVRSYCASHGVRTAINTLSEQGKSYLPDNLEWDELPSYYQSVLAAATVKTDFALLYLSIWDSVWKPALEACGVTEPWTIDDMQQEECPPSLDTLWDSGFYRTHYHPNDQEARIDTLVQIAIVQNQLLIYISLATWDAEEKPQELVLSTEWERSASDNGWYNTVKDAFPAIDPKTSTEIDCSRMRKAAEEALRQMMGF
ncbi:MULTISPECIES: hypothetical protein [unclassified Thiocapsa]|uniref:hypothetical protein n=1 Tax=unclassified Thiocapsa TaxID=2641286 RepID=UPI0035AF46BA